MLFQHPMIRFASSIKLASGLVATLFLLSCSTLGLKSSADEKSANEGQELRQDEKLGKVDPRYSISADRAAFEEIRKNVPDEAKKRNDELALLLNLMGQVKLAPTDVRDKFQNILSKKRDLFQKDMAKKREAYSQSEKKSRDQFLADQERARKEFAKDKHSQQERSDFYSDLDQKRRDFFAEQRDKRESFEADSRDQRKTFDDYIRERTDEFNQAYKDYVIKYSEAHKNQQ